MRPGYVTLPQAVMMAWENISDINDESSRSEFWWWKLFRWGVIFLLEFCVVCQPLGLPWGVFEMIRNLWVGLSMFPDASLIVRRFHDVGLQSGWAWAAFVGELCGFLVPLVGAVSALAILIIGALKEDTF